MLYEIRGRKTKIVWYEVIGNDMKMTEVCEKDAKDSSENQSKWKRRTRVVNPR